MQSDKCNHRSAAMQKKKKLMCKCNHRLFQGTRKEGCLEILGSWSMIYTFKKNLSAWKGDRRKASSEKAIANARA